MRSLLFILIIFFPALINISAQESESDTLFPVGVYAAATQNPAFTHYYNYDQILEMGTNFISQLAIKNVARLDQDPNYTQLIQFPFIFAANDSGFGTGVDELDAEDENTDWISYFTHAKYRKWEAEGDQLYNENVKVKHQSGSKFDPENSISGWRSDGSSEPGDFIVMGPDYWQYPRYTFSNPGWNPKPIYYKARFRLAIESESVDPLPVCRLMVTVKFPNAETPREDILADVILTTADLSTTFRDTVLNYNYIGYYDNGELPAYSYRVPGDIEDAPGYNIGSQVQFKVQWLGNRHVFVDYIEVYDVDIWETYFDDPDEYPEMITKIYNYDQEFKTLNTEFYSKLKYYGTQDEPHSIDCYEPLRKVQYILDSLDVGADLMTHWYPGWNSIRDGDNTWDQYYQTVHPKKLHFWYSPK